MITAKLNQLGARRIGDKSTDTDSSLQLLAELLPISSLTHRAVLAEIGGAIVFDNGAKFTTDEPSPLNRKSGYQRLEMLYGLGDEENSLVREAKHYQGQLPPSFVPIGESPGGNLICVDGAGQVFLWDHESTNDQGVWKVADSFDEFFKRLEPDNPGIAKTDGIIESESFLDF